MSEVSNLKFSAHNPSFTNQNFGGPSIKKQWTVSSHLWQPPTDVYESEKSIVVLVEIAGMREAEFVISLEKRMLVISGEREHHNVSGAFLRMEILSGKFITVVELPAAVQYEKVSADYMDGFLRVELPKSETVRVDVTEK